MSLMVGLGTMMYIALVCSRHAGWSYSGRFPPSYTEVSASCATWCMVDIAFASTKKKKGFWATRCFNRGTDPLLPRVSGTHGPELNYLHHVGKLKWAESAVKAAASILKTQFSSLKISPGQRRIIDSQ